MSDKSTTPPAQFALELPDGPATPSAATDPQQPRVLRTIAIAMALSGALLWGTWATHTILSLRDTSPHLAKVELADLVREFVQQEARSGEPTEAITARTGQFLRLLNGAVAAHARKGQVVLLGNAVVDGDVPDITSSIRAEVYAHQPRAPSIAPVLSDMKEVSHGESH